MRISVRAFVEVDPNRREAGYAHLKVRHSGVTWLQIRFVRILRNADGSYDVSWPKTSRKRGIVRDSIVYPPCKETSREIKRLILKAFRNELRMLQAFGRCTSAPLEDREYALLEEVEDRHASATVKMAA